MEENKKLSKKFIALTIIFIVVVGVALYFLIRHTRKAGPTEKQKVEMLKALNNDAANSAPVPLKEKEAILKDMNTSSQKEQQPTTDQKKALLNQYGSSK